MHEVQVREWGGGSGKLTICLLASQMLVSLFNLPAATYFSELSNSCAMNSVQVYDCAQ